MRAPLLSVFLAAGVLLLMFTTSVAYEISETVGSRKPCNPADCDAERRNSEAVAAFERGEFATAERIWTELAEQGFPSALSNMGLLYRDGSGVTKDPQTALNWFYKAADHGLAIGQHNLAMMYYDGIDWPQDFVEAEHWFRKAANQGYAPAQEVLGNLFLRGDGVRKDDHCPSSDDLRLKAA